MIEKEIPSAPSTDDADAKVGGERPLPTTAITTTTATPPKTQLSLPQLRIACKANGEGREPKEGNLKLRATSNKVDVSPAFVVSVVGSGALCFAVGSEALYPYFAGGFVLEGVVRLMKRNKILLSVCWSLGLFAASLVIIASRKGKGVAGECENRAQKKTLDLGGAMRRGRNTTILSLGGYLLAFGVASFSLVHNGEMPMLW